jgi:hypothetical protein
MWRTGIGGNLPKTIGLALAMTFAGGIANAAEPLPPPPPPAVVTQRPAGTVRLNVRPYRATKDVKLQVGDAQGGWAFVCNAPCSADVVPGTALRVTIGDSEEGHEFAMAGNPGNEMDLEVRPASKGPLAGGIVMASIGGFTALVGVILLAVAATPNRNSADLETPGWVCLLAGGGLTLGGIILIAKRTHEPRVRENEHTPSKESRPIARRGADLYTSDVSARGMTPLIGTGPAFTPLGFSVHF